MEERAESGRADIWSIKPIAELSPRLTRPLAWDPFNQSALIAPLLSPTNACNSFLFIEFSLIIISQPCSHQPTLMGQIRRLLESDGVMTVLLARSCAGESVKKTQAAERENIFKWDIEAVSQSEQHGALY